MTASEVARVAQTVVAEVEKAIIGKRETVETAVLTLLCEGHLLIEDVPGVGKTTLAKALSRAIGGEFRRIQFTPDLLPSDITGTSIFNQEARDFEFRPGPLFSNVVLVDEVNRATPKTQSALLEAMEERQISVDGVTHVLERPFFVLATQNNVEMTGTFPLPEAQLDRFFARVILGYPSRESEAEMIRAQQTAHPIDDVVAAVTTEEMIRAQAAVREVFVHDSVREYIVDVVRATRSSSLVYLGSSPRGSLYLMHAAQARAAMQGSDYVRPDDVKFCAPFVLGHRLMVRGEVRARGTTGEDIVLQHLDGVPVPIPA
ncbi:MAG: MoxR family ATPase [Fimbriimonadaceae bacterium]|nr:MoxR family ATPase [Fimbriimonadaceae bacterium]QYK54741.1 MAG: MoxR family ATPase [Fimbriimonadaceae bacterium]